jgi:polyisoprenoid-binding protein YceI
MTAETPAPPTLVAQLAAGGLAGEWALDAGLSEARFATRSIWGLVPVNGTFTRLTGHGTVSASGEAHGRLTIDTASLDSGNARRDAHLKSAAFLDAGKPPRDRVRPDPRRRRRRPHRPRSRDAHRPGGYPAGHRSP